MLATSERAAKSSVEDQIVGFNRQLAFALNFVESVVRQGNRRAAIEVLEEQRSAIARTSASVSRTLVAPLLRRRRIRVIGAVTLAGLLLGSSAFGAIAVHRPAPAPVHRSSDTADPHSALAGIVEAGILAGRGDTRAARGTSAAENSPRDDTALARATNGLIDETLSIAIKLSGFSSAMELTKAAVEAAVEAAAEAAAEAQAPQPGTRVPEL